MSGIDSGATQADAPSTGENEPQTIAKTLRDLDIAILKMKRDTGKKISNIFDGTASFTDYLDVGLLAAFAVVSALLIGSNAIWAVEARAGLNTMKSKIGAFLGSIGVRLLLTTHNLLMSVWTDYREFFEEIYNAAGGISSSLGYGLEFLPLALNNAEAVILASGAIIGKDPDEMKVSFLSTAATWIDRLDSNFNRYARNPGAVISDLNEFIKRESEKNFSDNFDGIIGTIGGIVDIAADTTQDVLDLETAIDTLIADLPADAFQAVQDVWGPFHADFTDFRDDYIIPSIEAVQDVVEQLTSDLDIERLTRAEMMDLFRSIPDGLIASLISNDVEGETSKRLLQWLLKNGATLGESSEPGELRKALDTKITSPPPIIRDRPDFDAGAVAEIQSTRVLIPPPPAGDVYAAIGFGAGDDSGNSIINKIEGVM